VGGIRPRNAPLSSTTARLTPPLRTRVEDGALLVDTRTHDRRLRVHQLVERGHLVGREERLDGDDPGELVAVEHGDGRGGREPAAGQRVPHVARPIGRARARYVARHVLLGRVEDVWRNGHQAVCHYPIVARRADSARGPWSCSTSKPRPGRAPRRVRINRRPP
jgi:hypothetical protein